MVTQHAGHNMPTVEPARKPKQSPQVSPWGGFGGVGLIWIAFFVLMVAWPGTLERLWEYFTDLHLGLRLLIGVLLLPWVLATWVWQGDWSTLVQVLVIGALVIGTTIAFRPRDTT
jgi:hypothetical protein